MILTGTQLGSYGFEFEDTDLVDMVTSVLQQTDVRRLRISSLQPTEFSDELLGLWSGIGKNRLCPHFHIPLQSGSDRILTNMRRRYTSAEFISAVQMQKALIRTVLLRRTL